MGAGKRGRILSGPQRTFSLFLGMHRELAAQALCVMPVKSENWESGCKAVLS